MFPPNVILVRSCLIDYLSGKNVSLENVFGTIKRVVYSKQLTVEEALKVIEKIEEDPLCLPHIPRIERRRRLSKLKKLLENLNDLEKSSEF